MTNLFKELLKIERVVAPSWYDNDTIIYLSNNTGTFQLYSYNRLTKERYPYTDYQNGIMQYLTSKVNHSIFFTKAKDGDELPQIYKLDIDSCKIIQLTKAKSVRYALNTINNDETLLSYTSNERNGKDLDVYIMDLETYKTKMIYKSSGAAYASHFSPDNSKVTIFKQLDNVSNQMMIYDFKTDKLTTLTKDKESLSVRARWIDDDTVIINSNMDSNFFRLIKYSISKQDYSDVLNTSQQYDVVGYNLSKDKTLLSIIYNKDGYSTPSIYNLNTQEYLPINFKTGMYRGITFSPDSSLTVYSYSTDTKPNNIYCLDLNNQTTTNIIRPEQELPAIEFSPAKLQKFKSFDSLEIPYFIYKPNLPDAELQNCPIIINIHGGPEAQYVPVFNPSIQYFVSQGYIVVCPNIRGSAGYGKDYLNLDNKDKRMDSVADIKYLQKNLRESGLHGPITLYGASYGGFMVYATLAKYPNLWHSGISIVGISNFITFLKNTAPHRRAYRESEYGSLRHDRELLASISPINHAQNIKVPVLIVHGKNDPRVPLSEAEQMYTALKNQKTPTDLVVYPDEGHGISKTKNIIDLHQKVLNFLNKYSESKS